MHLMAHSAGFEPATARFVAEYSIQLSYECVDKKRITIGQGHLLSQYTEKWAQERHFYSKDCAYFNVLMILEGPLYLLIPPSRHSLLILVLQAVSRFYCQAALYRRPCLQLVP